MDSQEGSRTLSKWSWGIYVFFLRFLDSKSYLDPKTTVRTSIFMGHDPINKTGYDCTCTHQKRGTSSGSSPGTSTGRSLTEPSSAPVPWPSVRSVRARSVQQSWRCPLSAVPPRQAKDLQLIRTMTLGSARPEDR